MSAETDSRASLLSRMVRASRLDIEFYEEVEHDTSANAQAFAVIVIASLAAGIGGAIAGGIEHGALHWLWGLLIGLGSAILGWLVWALFAYWIGTTMFKGEHTEATYGQLLRTLGFANAPGVLRVFSFIPFIGGFIAFVSLVWILVAGVVAVRQALDFTTGRAIATCIVGWLIYVLLMLLLSGLVLGAAVLF
jgi:hypothetical protein